MKKILFGILLFINALGFAQMQDNRFSEQEAEAVTDGTEIAPSADPAVQAGPGNPGDPVPVDNYIPFLAITAVGIMVYSTYRKKALL